MECNEPTRKVARSDRADLLAEDSPYRKFKAIPSTMGAVQGVARQRCKPWVEREVCVDRLNIRAKIEHAAYTGHDSW